MCSDMNYLINQIKLQLEIAKSIEITVTPLLSELAAKFGGRMHGLENKFKSEESALRKVKMWIADDATACKNDESYLNKKVAEIKDYLRYTIVLEEKDFTENVKEILRLLEDHKYKLNDLKNRFKESMYKDIISHYITDDVVGYSFVFELQFHTESSIRAKGVSHYIYEIVREFETKLKEIDDSIVNNLFKALIELYKSVSVPKNIEDIEDVD